ncbi:acetyl-CoA carboxylase biotin carboxylase subunit [Candidatus Deferrimicrobium sp.]|uniref:acetyl-CoA carboxylase biotin carboxylase subunit n=1 Tax=Candidatus Deferrimicrobium sp. TaxID=3060586 RepID=UPI003C35115C
MKKVLIANRGEIACRIIRSCRELRLGTVAVCSEPDREALHAKLADEAFVIGLGAPKDSYLASEKILDAARSSGADAIHPGYGFLAENYRFAEEVIADGLRWIGPRPDTIEDMGDKERARDIARAANVPVLAGSPRFLVGDLDGLEEAAEEVGYPLLVKSTAGGGGIGMKRVERQDVLRDTVVSTQGLAERAFKDGTVYLEKFIPRARHVEIQVFGYGDGHTVHLYERECSIQRRFQKIVEESPSPGFPDVTRQKMAVAAVSLAHHARYRGAGTVEFVVDADTFDFYFLEMNTRIQVEHPVTEMNTGLDLVSLQIRLARGDLPPFEQREILHRGHAIECRIYAENPDKNFLPSPGDLKVFEPPEATQGLRIDTGFRQGDKVSFHYDPMIAKIISHAPTRDAAIQGLWTALGNFRIEGVHTNIRFLRRILSHPAFREGKTHTGFIEEHSSRLFGD